MYTVKDVSAVAGISVRTLHHYDHIGLLHPDSVTESGYRLYSEDNLAALQHILFLKELDFSLKKIREIISSPGYDREEALNRQKELLMLKRDRLNKIIDAIDHTITSRKEGIIMSNNEKFNAFDMDEINKHQKKYAAEVKEKYGLTDAYAQSQKKTNNYTKDDWAAIKKESDAIMGSLSENMSKDPSEAVVQDLIGQWQQHISDRYYNCTKAILAGLGESYVDDERFAENIDKFGVGLSVFFRDAIRIYCQ